MNQFGSSSNFEYFLYHYICLHKLYFSVLLIVKAYKITIFNH